MASSPHESKPLSVYRTFVVQLHADAGGGGQCAGRVEHVASGRSVEFPSAEVLLEFLSDNIADESISSRAQVR